MLSHKAILHVVCLIVVYLYCVRATPDYSDEDHCLLPGKLSTNRNETMFICGNISSICEYLKELGSNTLKCDWHSKKDKTAETTYTCLCVYTPSKNQTCCQYLCATNHVGGYAFYILSGLGFIAVGTLSIYAALALIALLGFMPGGIVAGLPAAWMMAVMPVGIVGLLQSIGVLGFSISTYILLFTTGGSAGGWITGYVFRLGNETLYEYCNCTCNVSAIYNVALNAVCCDM